MLKRITPFLTLIAICAIRSAACGGSPTANTPNITGKTSNYDTDTLQITMRFMPNEAQTLQLL
ncbi:MAG: hypothetical protein AAGF95_20270 [Chloroflexota bacterium]